MILRAISDLKYLNRFKKRCKLWMKTLRLQPGDLLTSIDLTKVYLLIGRIINSTTFPSDLHMGTCTLSSMFLNLGCHLLTKCCMKLIICHSSLGSLGHSCLSIPRGPPSLCSFIPQTVKDIQYTPECHSFLINNQELTNWI